MFQPPRQRLDLTTVEWLQDLERLAEILSREHAAPIHSITRESFDRHVSAIRAAIPELDGIEVALAMQKLAASIGDGHTSVRLPEGRPRLPADFYWFNDGLRVIGISAAHRGLVGARLLAINGVPVEELTTRLRAYVPQRETEWFHRAQAPERLNDPDLLRSLGLSGNAFTFTLEGRDQAQMEVDLKPETKSGTRVLLGGSLPLWRRHQADAFRSERLADGSVYVNWRSYDRLGEYAASLMQELDADHPRRLIIDLRDNDGGDYTIGRAFIDEIRSRPWLNRQGVLYVLIGRRTFSAAMTNAVDFHKSTNAILVGEPAGAAPNNWQEVRRFHLPLSGLTVSVSTGYFEFLPGKSELLPDRLVEPTPGDWAEGNDGAVRWILEQP